MTIIRLSDRLAKLERRLSQTPSRPLAEAEARILALTDGLGFDADDPEQVVAVLDMALAQVRAARRR